MKGLIKRGRKEYKREKGEKGRKGVRY